MRKNLFDKTNRRIRSGAGFLAISLLFGVVPIKSLFAAGSTWSAQKPISPVLQPDPTRGSQLNDVAVNTNGLTVAAWEQYTYNNGGNSSIGISVQSGGRWSTPCFFSGLSGSCIDPNAAVSDFSMNPRVAVGADGTMAVSWTNQDPVTITSPRQRIQVAVKPAEASNWATTTLAEGPMGGVAITPPVPVGIDANGNVTAAWTLWNGARHEVQTATLPKNGAWSAPTIISDGLLDDSLYLSLSINARGDAAVVYSHSPYASNSSNCSPNRSGTCAYYVSRSALAGNWTIPVQISETMSSSSGYITGPQVALDPNGFATVIYMGYGVEGTRQLNDGSWTPYQTVIPAPNSVSSYQSVDLGVDLSGNAVVAASIFDATIGVDRSSVWVTRGNRGDTLSVWGNPLRLTDPSIPVDAYATRVAVSPDGALTMVGWIDHYHGTVQVSKLSNGSWGAANTIGRGTAYSSFQEILGLDAGSGTVARAIWKNAKSGTQIYAASYN